MREKSPSRIRFEKAGNSGTVQCVIELFDDGSAYVYGNEIEVIFEFASNNLENATKHVEGLGYVQLNQDD